MVSLYFSVELSHFVGIKLPINAEIISQGITLKGKHSISSRETAKGFFGFQVDNAGDVEQRLFPVLPLLLGICGSNQH